MTSLALACKLNAARTPTSLAARALAAIRRNGGTLLLPGAATPLAGGGFTYGNPPLRNYLDSAGTDILDSVTQVDQPVGLCLDSMGVLGPELFTGDYTVGASVTATFAGNEATATFVGGALTSTGANWLSVTTAVVPLGTFCVVEFDAQWVSGSDLQVGAGYTVGRTISAAGNGGVKRRYTATTAAGHADVRPCTFGSVEPGAVWKITVISTRVMSGNHASQPTTASKPILRWGLVNQLLWGGDFSNAAWQKASTTLGASTADPNGGTSATIAAFAYGGTLRQNSIAWTAGTVGTIAVWVRKSTSGGANAIRLTTNNTAAWNTGITQKFTLTAEWQLVVMSGVLTSTGTTLSVIAGGIDAGASGDDDCTGNVDIYRAALYQGTVTASQILAAGGIPLTTTAAASSERGRYWWQFDGSNDSFSTSITTGNEGWVCAGVTLASGAILQTIASSGGGDTTQKGVFLVSNGGGALWAYVGNGSARFLAQTPVTAGVPQVLSMGWSVAGVTAGVNNTESAPTALTGDVTGQLPLRIGQFAEGTLPLNGPMSAEVYCPVLPSAADRALIRRFVGSLQGQTL